MVCEDTDHGRKKSQHLYKQIASFFAMICKSHPMFVIASNNE